MAIKKSLLVTIGVDTKAMRDGLKSMDDKIQGSAEKIRRAGQVMTVAGLGIALALGKIVKEASDAQETSSKFGTVFQDVFGAAADAAKNLADNYGLSTVAAQTMLASTGDLLTGLGATGAQALELSEKTQQLAVDLASFTNFSGGAAGASDALTKAMLGERESLKALGIVISEAAVKSKLLEKGQKNLKGAALLQAKAFITLEIATEQSKNAIGDFARTSDSFANQSKILTANIQDLAVELGTQLIPLATALATKISEVVKKVTEWTQENPVLTGVILKVVAAIGALMLVVGPLLIALPAISAGIAAVGAVSLAAVGAIAATTAGIGLLVVAAAAAVTIFNQLKNAKEAAMEADERFERQNAKLREKLLEASDAAGMTRAEFIKLEQAYNGNTAALGHAIQRGKEGKKLQEALAKVGKEHAGVIKEQKKAQEKASKAATETNVVLKAQGTIIEKLVSPWDDLEQSVLDAADAFVGGKITMTEYQIKLRETEAETKRLADEFGNLDMAVEDSEVFIEDWGNATDEVFKQIGLTAPSEIGKIKDALTETIDIMDTRWGTVIEGMSGAFGQFVFDVLSTGSTFAENLTGLWEGVKNTFKNVVADMAKEWAENFIKKLITKGASAVVDVGKNILDLGKSVTGAITSIGSAASGIFVGIGAAVGTFLGGLIGKKTTGWQKAMQALALQTTQLLFEIRDYTKDSIIVILKELEKQAWRRGDQLTELILQARDQSRLLGSLEIKGDRIVDQLKGISKFLESIQKTSEITAIRLKSLAGFKTGGNFRPIKESLITVHAGEDVRITQAGRTPGGGGNTYNANFYFSGQLDPGASRRLVREQFGPQFIEYVRTNTDRANSKLNQALGK